jgi:hypothetical protein
MARPLEPGSPNVHPAKQTQIAEPAQRFLTSRWQHLSAGQISSFPLPGEKELEFDAPMVQEGR